MASAGTITVDFAAETSKFTADLNKVNERLKGMESSFSSLGNIGKTALAGAAAAALVSFGREAISAAAEIDRLKDKTGIAVESLSRLQFAAEQSDTEFQSLTTAITQFQKRIGTGEAAKALDRIGVSFDTIRSLSPEQQLVAIAKGFESLHDPAKRVAESMELFGKAGADILPFLSQGAAGIENLTKSAEALDARASAALDHATHAAEGFLSTLKVIIANTSGDFLARISGTGSKLLDAQVKLQDLQNQQARALARGFSTSAIDQQVAAQQKVIDKLQQIVDLQEKALNPKFASNHQAITAGLTEAVVTGKRQRIPGSPTNFEEIQQDFDEERLRKFNEVRLETFKDFEKNFGDFKIKQEQELSNGIEGELKRRADAEQFWREFSLDQHQQYVEAKLKLEQGAFDAGIGLLRALAARSKAAAITLIAINKGLAIAKAIQNTSAAATGALLSVPYPANLAAAAHIKALGALEIATIAATGFVEAGNVGSGGASFGSSANPVFTSNADTSFSNDARSTATSQKTVQVIFQGNVYGFDDFSKSVADALKDLDGRDVVIFSQNGAQAQTIRAA